MGKKTNLPKDVPIGTTVSRTLKVKGNKRKLTFKRTRPRGKNKNLTWKIISNKKA